MTAAAWIAIVLLGILTLFQLALAAGAPWGRAAYGGVWEGVVPRGIRINALVFGLLIYPFITLYFFDSGEIAEFDWLPGDAVVMWVLVVFFGFSAVMNAISRSNVERNIWTGPALALTICTLVLALG